ncbi:MAG: aldo/keto reductase [Thermoplasmata archaeon]|nr:aldo/keto reductase [Thermoplasmata archaeon]
MALRPGLATPEGTRRFAERGIASHHLPPEHFRTTPDGLTLSSIGLGTYLGPADTMTDTAVEQAALLCATSGRINVFDTAINYRHQRAERSLGRSFGQIVDGGRPVLRDELFVATKVGYLAPDGESGLPAHQWIERELLEPGVVRPNEIVGGSHVMTRRFMLDQVARSQKNLGLATIDLLYLHNAPDSQLEAVGRSEFRDRLTEAFRTLESLRSDGAIGSYGLATWDSLRVPRSHPLYLGLGEAVAIAREVGGETHGFRYIQFPFNLALPEAASVKNQMVGDVRMTLLEAAPRLGLASFTSVPLLQGQLVQSGPALGGLSTAQSALQFARSAPGVLAPLVGQKQPEHLSENLQVAERPPWEPAEFWRHLG